MDIETGKEYWVDTLFTIYQAAFAKMWNILFMLETMAGLSQS